MLTQLENWDQSLRLAINLGLVHPWNDWLMKFWSAEWPWMSLALFFLARSAWRKDWSRVKVVLWIGLTVGLTDLLAAQLLKPLVGRIRPCKVEALVRVVDGCGGMLSFPSNHSANAATFAVLWFFYAGPRQGLLAVGSAFIIGFSRVYLGVHYPSDILGGFCFGAFIAILSNFIWKRMKKKGAEAPSNLS